MVLININQSWGILIKLRVFPTPRFRFCAILETENSEMENLGVWSNGLREHSEVSSPSLPFWVWCKMENSELENLGGKNLGKIFSEVSEYSKNSEFSTFPWYSTLRISRNLVIRYRLDSVLRIDQCTLQYRIRLFNRLVLKIYVQCTLMCDGVLSVIDLNNRYRQDSVLCLDQCTLQYCFRLFN